MFSLFLAVKPRKKKAALLNVRYARAEKWKLLDSVSLPSAPVKGEEDIIPKKNPG